MFREHKRVPLLAMVVLEEVKKNKIMRNLELESFGLVEMNSDESETINGGVWWLPIAVVGAIVISAVNNFGDIADGFVDGVNGREPRCQHK